MGGDRGRWQVFARSAAVGAGATLVDLLALFLLVRGLGLRPTVANVPALLVGVAAQFAGNKLFAFRDRAGGRALAVQGGRFALVEAGALALNAVLFHLLVTLFPGALAAARLLASAAVYLGWSQPLWGRIFRPEPA